MPFPRLALPPLARIGRKLTSANLPDPRREVRQQLLDLGVRGKVAPGARIAITAPSWGMGGFVEVLSGIVEAVKEAGGEPFLVPAMGSDGGAVAENQAEVLRLLGVTEEAVGAPIRATMETYVLGNSRNGAAVHIDRNAAEADGIIVCGRGLLKTITVGLGKQRGSQEAHSHGLQESVWYVPEVVFPKSKILFGVAVVENGYRRPAVIEVVPASYEAFLKADARLLEVARPHVAKLPFEKLELLIVDEIGQTISGSGMDRNVIGSSRATGEGKKGDPEIARIVVLSLTKPSLGNGLGIGLADFTTRRFFDAYDQGATYVNLLTAMEPGRATREASLPLALESDREAAEVALYSSLPRSVPRICRIASTARLDEMWVSEPLLKELEDGTDVLERPRELPYDTNGNLF
jgi:hypothetical protein